MWNLLVQSVTDLPRVICNVLVFVIPFTIYKINLKLHEQGDPPWKKEAQQEKDSSELPR